MPWLAVLHAPQLLGCSAVSFSRAGVATPAYVSTRRARRMIMGVRTTVYARSMHCVRWWNLVHGGLRARNRRSRVSPRGTRHGFCRARLPKCICHEGQGRGDGDVGLHHWCPSCLTLRRAKLLAPPPMTPKYQVLGTTNIQYIFQYLESDSPIPNINTSLRETLSPKSGGGNSG